MKGRTLGVLALCDEPCPPVAWAEDLAGLGIDCSMVVTPRQPRALEAIVGADLLVVDVYGERGSEALHQRALLALFECQRLRRRTQVPILYISPLDEADHMLDAYEAGVDEYLVRPVSLPMLQAKIRAWLRWPAQRPLPPAGSTGRDPLALLAAHS